MRWILYGFAALIALSFAAAGEWVGAFLVVSVCVVVESVRRLRRPTSVAGANLDLTENLIRAGALKGSLKTLERAHRHAVERDDVAELERVATLAEMIATRAYGRTRSRASWLARSARDDLVSVRRRVGEPRQGAPAAPPPPPSLAPHGLARRARAAEVHPVLRLGERGRGGRLG